MLTMLLLVAAVFSCSSVLGLPIDHHQETTSLRYIYAFFRHGIRSPLYPPYPKDPHKTDYHKKFHGPPGELTTVGKKQMYEVGIRLKNKYEYFLGSFSDEKAHVTSTNTSRTMMTALSVMAGLYPPSKPFLKDLKWQPIPIWLGTEDFDKVYFYNDPEFPKLSLEICPAFGQLIQKGYQVTKNEDTNENRAEIYELLRKHTGRSDVNSINTLYEVFDVLQFEDLNNLEPPEWAKKPQPNYDNKCLYPDILSPLMVEWFLDAQYLNKDEKMLEFYSGPLFDNIFRKFQRKINEPSFAEIFRFHATHDDTIYTLLWALQAKDEHEAVGPGDGIVFELHQKTITEQSNNPEEYYVEVWYFDSLRGTETKLDLPQCPNPCTLSQFGQTYHRLTPSEWREKCQES